MIKHFELRRNIFHLFYGLTYVLLIYFNIFHLIHLLVLLLIGTIIALASLKYKLPFISWFLEKFERPDTFPGKGALTFLVGVIFAVALFDKSIALAAIAILTVGDSFSHIVGRFYGKIKNPLNSLRFLEGTLIGALCASFGAMLFVSPIKAFIASFIAMIVEAVDIKLLINGWAKRWVFDVILDDNVIVPLVAGVVLSVL
ncbi:hypothetical protein HY636_05330 [Candidatus Woesearchaeota archaeon]|nr:hypothetical protein [Candidatus Woesearchaeota archaeon]